MSRPKAKVAVSISSSSVMLWADSVAPSARVTLASSMSSSMALTAMLDTASSTSMATVSSPAKVKAVRSGVRVRSYFTGPYVGGQSIG